MISLRLLFILVFCVSASFATQFDVHNANDFVTLVNKAANGDFNYDIVLWIDLDFTNDTLRSVVDNLPLGMKSNTDCTPYSGTFDGRGHIVKNLEMTDKEYSGLICDSRDAVIKNLVIDKTCSFSGNIVGGVTVNVSGSISVSKVEIYGRMNGRNVSGGIMGIVSDVNGGSIVVDDCGFFGTIAQTKINDDGQCGYFGGFVGLISLCTNLDVRLSRNKNNGIILSFVGDIGGFIGALKDYNNVNVSLSENENNLELNELLNCSHSANFGGVFGNIAGFNLRFTMENNKNNITVNASVDGQANAGGFVGCFRTSNVTLLAMKNTNSGSMFFEASGQLYAGGYFGFFYDTAVVETVFESNANDGTVRVSEEQTGSAVLGGFGGYFYACESKGFQFSDNTNNGDVIAANKTASSLLSYKVGCFFGALYTYFSTMELSSTSFKNNNNNGNVRITGGSPSIAGGFVGYFYTYRSGNVFFQHNNNNGDINIESSKSTSHEIGGLFGEFTTNYQYADDRVYSYFINNTNHGKVICYGGSIWNIGGFVGYAPTYRSSFFFNNNTNYGLIKTGSSVSRSYTGCFIGNVYCPSGDPVHFVNNTNYGNIEYTGDSSFYLGALAGFFSQSDSRELLVINNTNYGLFSLQRVTANSGGSGSYCGGFIGNFEITGKELNQTVVVNNTNFGNITLAAGNSSTQFFMGGFAGFIDPDDLAEFYFCDNINNGYLSVQQNIASSTSYIGALVGYIDMDDTHFFFNDRNINNGVINAEVDTVSCVWYFGGIVGYLYSSTRNETSLCDNVNNGDILITGNINHNTGGIIGYASMSSKQFFYFRGNVNKAYIKNSKGSSGRSSSTSYIGGLGGYISFSGYKNGFFNGNVNEGNISIETSYWRNVCTNHYIGGLIARFSCFTENSFHIHDNLNNGSIHATSDSFFYCGGLFGDASSAGTSFFSFNTNNGNIYTETVSSMAYSCPSFVGGFIGRFYSSSSNVQFSESMNNGNIKSMSGSSILLGGYIGYLTASGFKETALFGIKNNGHLSAMPNCTFSECCFGGVLGRLELSESMGHRFYNNNNIGSLNVEVINASFSSTGGLVGALDLSKTQNCSFDNNTNNGEFTITGTCEKANHGGIIGAARIQHMNMVECHSFRATDNNNNGKSSFNLRIDRSPTSNNKLEYGIGGLFGTFVSDSIFSAKIESNTNDGSIEGTVETGSVYAGGIVGGMPSAANVSVVGNTNKAMIKITCPEVDEFQSFVGGIMGMYSNSSLMKMNLRDNANYGDIISECIRHEVGTCGLVCSTDNEGESEMTIENCVNHGDVEGSVAYGICDVVKKAKNVVNIGEVSGTRETYSIWKELRDSATTVYCGSAKCTNCNKNVKSIVLDKNDGRYHVVEDNKVIVDEALNEEVDKEGYEKRWDKELKLRRYVNVYIGSPVDRKVIVYVGTSMEESGVPEDITKYHLIPEGKSAKTDNEVKKTTIIEEELHLVPYYLVTISGAVNEKIYIRADKKQNLGDISKKLKEYFESKEYAIGNTDTNELYEGERSVNGDLNIAVMRRNTVVIEMEGESVLAVDVNANEIAEEISVLTGIDTDNILVNIISDDNGYILRIIVVLKDVDLCDDVAAAINSLVKGEKCNAGILCRSREARIILPGQDISIGNRIGVCFEPKILGWFISLLMMEMAVLL